MDAATRKARFETFAALHRPGDPVILYNIWDPGSARVVAGAGAQAIATGSHPVGDALGFGDGEKVPLEHVFDNAARIVAAVDLPVTVDFEGAYATDPGQAAANVARLAETGAIGCNFEDQVIGGNGLHPVEAQAARIRAIRAAVGPDFFINARTDLFLKNKDADPAGLIDEALARAEAYAEAGASGFFIVGIGDADVAARLCQGSPLPVNLFARIGAGLSIADLAKAGAARISHGPGPYNLAKAALGDGAKAVYSQGNT